MASLGLRHVLYGRKTLDGRETLVGGVSCHDRSVL